VASVHCRRAVNNAQFIRNNLVGALTVFKASEKIMKIEFNKNQPKMHYFSYMKLKGKLNVDL
jgi:dTDP-D-glucose 4,6-dehydratase